ncbi:MBG domain-containing protein [Muribaculum intestinale]|uniref:MBG domain-containing protein n=1 Tax=Muribaculum intestinale TaxID=1796646 RepID=UPI0025A986B5|nr:MBG domain-containing protein [Muribaculum intestinale]
MPHIIYNINASPTSDAGVYPIILSGANGANYRFEYEAANLIINKAPLSGIINNCNRIYGEYNPSFSMSFTGLKNNELSPIWTKQPRFITYADKYSSVGVYPVSVSDYDAKNYTIDTIEDGTRTITPRKLVLKVNDSDRLYYQDNPTFTYTSTGFVNGDDISVLNKTPEFSTDATIYSNVGMYAVEIFGAEARNYDISYIPGNLIVNKRVLKVVADNKTRRYMTDNPVLTYTIAGFINNETENILLKRPIAQTNATILSDCGEYIIKILGAEAENYDFEYITGLLTITKIDQVIQWKQTFENIHIGDQIELLATADSGLPIEYIISGNVEEYKSGDRTYIDCLGCGEVSIRATQEGSVNYNPAMRVVKYFTISEDASIDNINSDDYSLNIYTKDGYVVNGSLSQQYIEVYDVSGNCKYHGTDKKIHVGKGIVIVRVNGRSYKLVCK